MLGLLVHARDPDLRTTDLELLSGTVALRKQEDELQAFLLPLGMRSEPTMSSRVGGTNRVML